MQSVAPTTPTTHSRCLWRRQRYSLTSVMYAEWSLRLDDSDYEEYVCHDYYRRRADSFSIRGNQPIKFQVQPVEFFSILN